MAADEIRYLGDLQRLQPQPGDVYVLTIERDLTAAQTEHVRARWESVMGEAKLLVLSGGMKLGVIAEG